MQAPELTADSGVTDVRPADIMWRQSRGDQPVARRNNLGKLLEFSIPIAADTVLTAGVNNPTLALFAENDAERLNYPAWTASWIIAFSSVW